MGQTVRHIGENEDAGMVSRGNYAESHCGEAAAKCKGREEGDGRQQGSAGAGHAAGQEAKWAPQALKCRTGESATAVSDRPPIKNCLRTQERSCWLVKRVCEDDSDCLPEEAGDAVALHRQEAAPHRENGQEAYRFLQRTLGLD
jgi:hypothetical protein